MALPEALEPAASVEVVVIRGHDRVLGKLLEGVHQLHVRSGIEPVTDLESLAEQGLQRPGNVFPQAVPEPEDDPLRPHGLVQEASDRQVHVGESGPYGRHRNDDSPRERGGRGPQLRHRCSPQPPRGIDGARKLLELHPLFLRRRVRVR